VSARRDPALGLSRQVITNSMLALHLEGRPRG
jgi:hypothetical protein